MQYQELLQQTEQMNQQEIFNYLHDLQRITKRKFNQDLFWEYWKTYMQEDSVSKADDIHLKGKRKFGMGKGIIKYMSEDFDEPVEDLADKMY